MNILIYFSAFVWDNYQGGSGEYVSKKIYYLVPSHTEAKDIWQNVHEKIKENLKETRPFDQTVYTKNQGEYLITTVELL